MHQNDGCNCYIDICQKSNLSSLRNKDIMMIVLFGWKALKVLVTNISDLSN